MSADARLSELLAALDTAPDELHGDITPAVLALAKLGWVAAPALLDHMLSESADTRLHAQRAFEGIVMQDFGFVRGRGFAKSDDESHFRELWASHGAYAHDASEVRRCMAVEAWRSWLKEQGHD